MQPGSSGTPLFRGAIPAYAPPDRAAWAQEHGVAPFELDVPLKFEMRARAAIERDATTLGFDPAVNAHASLDLVHLDVQATAGLPGTTLVFFDPRTDSFWAYPEGPESA